MITRSLTFLGAHATRFLFVSLFVGLLLPDFAHLMRPLLTAVVAVVLSISIMRIEWSGIVFYVRRPLLVIGLVVWILVLSPVVMWGVAQAMGMAPGLAAGLVLLTMSPPITSAAAMAIILRLDARLSLIVLVLTMLAVPLTMPILATQLVRVELDITTLELMGRLAALVGGCFVAGAVGRRIIGRHRIAAAAHSLDGLMTLLLVVFAVGVMDGVTARLMAAPAHVFAFLGVAFAANLALQLAGGLATAWTGSKAALSAAYSSGTRNSGILLAVLPAGADSDIFLFFAVAQPPIFMLPAMMLPFYRRMVGR